MKFVSPYSSTMSIQNRCVKQTNQANRCTKEMVLSQKYTVYSQIKRYDTSHLTQAIRMSSYWK